MTEKARKALADAAKDTSKDAEVRSPSHDPTEQQMREGKSDADLKEARTVPQEDEKSDEMEDEEPKPPPKKIPVFFLDEAHKLPALIQAEDAMKSLLDSMLVLTKQVRRAFCLPPRPR